jgi:hypothetical protein
MLIPVLLVGALGLYFYKRSHKAPPQLASPAQIAGAPSRGDRMCQLLDHTAVLVSKGDPGAIKLAQKLLAKALVITEKDAPVSPQDRIVLACADRLREALGVKASCCADCANGAGKCQG